MSCPNLSRADTAGPTLYLAMELNRLDILGVSEHLFPNII